MTGSPDRRQREEDFFDRQTATLLLPPECIDRSFEGSTAPENRFLLSRMGELSGKTLLDLGCGAGENAVYFARRGARCVAGDCSSGMVEATRSLAREQRVNLEVRKIDAAALDFEDETFDIIYGANVLHHVDAAGVLAEIHRVLKPGGIACTWDPLKYNPLINVYRVIAAPMRSDDERPLGRDILDTARNLFSEVEYDTFWISALWIFLRFFLLEGADPRKEAYWKKIIREEPRLRGTAERLESVDHHLKRIPGIRWLAWNIALAARK